MGEFRKKPCATSHLTLLQGQAVGQTVRGRGVGGGGGGEGEGGEELAHSFLKKG